MDQFAPWCQRFIGFKKLVVEMRFLQAQTLGYSHHEYLRGYLARACQHPADEVFSQSFVLDPLENGSCSFAADMHYKFALTVLPSGEDLLGVLMRNIADDAFRLTLPKQALGCDLQFVAFYDGFTENANHHPIQHTNQLTPLTWGDLQQKSAELAAQERWQLQLLTPLQVKVSQQRAPNFETGPFVFARLWQIMLNRLAHDSPYPWRDIPCPQATLKWHCSEFLHHRYGDSGKPSCGVVGVAELAIIQWLPEQCLVLVLANLLGIGQGTARGHGVLGMSGCNGQALFQRSQPAQTALQRLAGLPAFQQHLVAALQKAKPTASALLEPRLEQEFARWRRGECSEPVLFSHAQQLHGKTRILLRPQGPNSYLLKALQKVLNTELASYWHPYSFAYQAGKSTQNAHDTLTQKMAEGYCWFYKTDLASCFASIRRQQVVMVLAALFAGSELHLFVQQWLYAASELGCEGLPEGFSLSSLLCNLYLTSLDYAVNTPQSVCIRFGDDLVLLVKNESQLAPAIQRLHTEFARLGVTENLTKQSSGHISVGFAYLGWRFIDGYSVAVAREEVAEAAAPSFEPKQLLVVAGEPAFIEVKKNRLVVRQESKTSHYPWHQLAAILCIGNHNITMPTLKSAMQHQVPLHLADLFGRYQGVCSGQFQQHAALSHAITLKNYLAEHNIQLSQQLIAERIMQIYHTIRRRGVAAASLSQLLSLEKQVHQATSLEQIRGYEGIASRILWQQFNHWYGADWHFHGRKRRPPPDPINAMLSLGYTQLYAITDSLLRSLGVWPYTPMFHQEHGEHACLASDLMETQRHQVERVVLTLINRQQVKPEDFAVHVAGAEMSSEARKLFLHALAQKLYGKEDGTAPVQQLVVLIRKIKQGASKATSDDADSCL